MTASADSIKVLEQRTLQRAKELDVSSLVTDFTSTVKLGSLDQLVHPSIPIAVVFVYRRSELSGSDPILIERLERALRLLLDYYPHLTGRMQLNPANGTHAIAHIGTGAKLLVAQCSEPLDAFRSARGRLSLLELPGSGNALLAPYNPMNIEGLSGEPLFTIQYTRFACRGVALGVRLPHAVCAADGYLKFMSNLAELYRSLKLNNLPSLTRPPCVRPYLSGPDDMTPEERQAALAYQPSLLHLEATDTGKAVEESSSATKTSSPPVTGRVLRFSGSELELLKAHATDPNGGSWVTTFEALCALFHQSVYRSRLQYQAKTQCTLSPPDFLTPVNIAGNSDKGIPELPSTYFPNNLLCAYSAFSSDLLSNGPLWQVAKQLHEMTRSHFPTALDVKKTIQWVTVQPDKNRIKPGFRYGNGSLMISSWAKFDMYAGTEFEEGEKPALVVPPFTSISLLDGLGYVLPTEMHGEKLGGDKGALDVYLALSDPLWEVLEKDEQMRRFSSEWSNIAKSG